MEPRVGPLVLCRWCLGVLVASEEAWVVPVVMGWGERPVEVVVEWVVPEVLPLVAEVEVACSGREPEVEEGYPEV